jgi:hypothetical protein
MAKICTFHVGAIAIPEHDDDVHISGAGFSAPNTLCGITDDGESHASDEKPNCTGCIEIYESIKKHRPRFDF